MFSFKKSVWLQISFVAAEIHQTFEYFELFQFFFEVKISALTNMVFNEYGKEIMN